MQVDVLPLIQKRYRKVIHLDFFKSDIGKIQFLVRENFDDCLNLLPRHQSQLLHGAIYLHTKSWSDIDTRIRNARGKEMIRNMFSSFP